MRNISDKRCTQTQNTHFMFNNSFFSENRDVYEKMRKNLIDTQAIDGNTYGAYAAYAGQQKLQTHTQNK